MTATKLGKRWLACFVLLAGGCGAIPDFMVDAGRDAAKDVLEEAVEEAARGVVQGLVDELEDLSDLSLPLEVDGDSERDADELP